MESPAAKFQWFKGASAIPGQTGVSLALFDLTEADYGTYTVKATANGITVESAPAVIRTPAEAAYAAYVDGFDLDLETDGAPGADHDRDGVANLLEYLLGGNPIIPNPGILPALSSTPSGNGRTLTFTYDRKITVEGIQQIVEHSSTLTPPWTAATHGESGVTIAAAPVPGNAGLERVTVTIPVTGGKRFARLRATW
ncbi:MAG: hypothetical protein EOP87_07300 [Verrucomicrobiaceae bacterium]|nr:MAG: hypothetical protein EOP87_07300 [Verrucomicrobiaceae bacterium]